MDAELEPSPGMADLDALAGRTQMAGVDVDLRVDVDQRLPDGVELTVYRIVQEALTNVVKHAAPTSCRVHVAENAGMVTIDVCDDGPGPRQPTSSSSHRHPDHGSGGRAAAGVPVASHGLIGMYERVMVYGGTFSAGPRAEEGFAVHAALPYAPGTT